MGAKTGISWTDATWSPVTGCSKVSPGCANCYAETLALTRLAGKPGYPGLPWTPENAEANVVLRPDRLDQPLRWRKPRRIFVNSMSDLFHEQVPDEFILAVFDVMNRATYNGGANAGRIRDAEREGHIFQVLTKRPNRMRTFVSRLRFDPVAGLSLDGPGWQFMNPGIWLGTSVENQRWADERIPELFATPARVRFLSMEPLLGPVDLRAALFGWCPEHDFSGFCIQRHHEGVQHLSWVIVGGESGSGHRPMDPAWVRDIANQCDAAGIPLFVKQASGSRSGKQGNIPDDLWARKEYPL